MQSGWRDRPLPELEPSPLCAFLAFAGLMVVAACSAWLWSSWDRLPETVYSHFGPSGAPDGSGARETLIAMPAMALLVWAVLGVLSRFPRKFNYAVRITQENAQRQYALGVSLLSWMRLFVPALMCYIAWAGAMVSLGEADGLDPAVMIGITAGMALMIVIHVLLMVRDR